MGIAVLDVVREPVGMDERVESLRSDTQASYGFRYSLLRLKAWPNLTQVAEERIPLMARICALLACKPTTASLIPLVLSMPEEEVYAVIKLLADGDYVEVVGAGSSQSIESSRQNVAAAMEIEAGKKQVSSIIGNLWQRLLVRS